MAQPANFFENLAGVPVLYDRLKPDHYGKVGIPYKFHCTPDLQVVLEALFADLFTRTVAQFGPAQRILSAGAWVNKPGQHGLGNAFDLDAIHWERVQFVALQQPVQKPLYLAIQALCNKHFGVVLGYDYNPAHRDHLHIDISRVVRFRETNSVTSFVQQALNAFYGQTLEVDGEFGTNTENALNETLAVLGIPEVSTSDNWRKFLEAVSIEGIRRVTAALEVETAAVSSLVEPIAVEAPAAMADIDADPALAIVAEAAIEAPVVLARRQDTGRIDLSYKPFQIWAISSRTVGNTEQWFVDFDDVSQFYVGYRMKFQNQYVGLARTGSSKATHVPYDHESYIPPFGEWASFIFPTARCESEAQFLVVNSWDAAAMTLSFIQMAAHTGEHLANLFRELMEALPDEADKFFPELKLGSQIGLNGSRKLFAVNGMDRLDLDVAVRPSDGLPSEPYYRGRFMEFFNPHRGRIDREEVTAAARWLAWMMKSPKAREICVENAVNGAKIAVKRVHDYVRRQHHPLYPNGLDGVIMDLVAAAMDVKHHGRRNRDTNQTNDQSIFAALTAADPLAAFEKIDTGWREDRSKRSVKEIKAMRPWFKDRIYDAATETFPSRAPVA